MLDAATMDSETIGLILADQDKLAERRAIFEPTYREIDRFIDPFGAGGFIKTTGSPVRDVEQLYDVTAMDSLDRYTAAIAGITVPRGQTWHGVAFADNELMKITNVRRWCDTATAILFSERYDPDAGFEAQIHEDIRQEGKYGTSALWIGERQKPGGGIGLFYKTLHLSESYIDENFAGRINRHNRI